MSTAQIEAFYSARDELIKVIETPRPHNTQRCKDIYEALVKIVSLHASVEPESNRNYAVMLQHLLTISLLYKEAVDYPKNLGESEDIIIEDNPFPYPELCTLFATCFEKVGDITSRINYETDHTITLQSIWKANGKKEADFNAHKEWSEKAKEHRNRKMELIEMGRDQIATNARAWKNFQIRRLPPRSPPETLQRINQQADEMEVKEAEEFEKSFCTALFQFQHPLNVDQLSVNKSFLLAQQLQEMMKNKPKAFKRGDVVRPDMKAFLYCSVDPGACNWCGCVMDEEKAIRCEKDCKGNNKGTYCSVMCRDHDASIHAVYCSTPKFCDLSGLTKARQIIRAPDHSATHALALQLYIRAVAYCVAQHKSPADFWVFNQVMRAALDETVPVNHPSKTRGIDLQNYKFCHQSALNCCHVNIADPRHDFYMHTLLIIGIRKFVIPIYGDRSYAPALVNTECVDMIVKQSKAVGAALFPDLIQAQASCLPNVELVTGIKKAGDAPTTQLVALEDIKEGEPLRFCYCSRIMLHEGVRSQENATRRIYCKCDLCLAQSTVNPDVQMEAMKTALVEAYKKDLAKKAEEAKQEKKNKNKADPPSYNEALEEQKAAAPNPDP